MSLQEKKILITKKWGTKVETRVYKEYTEKGWPIQEGSQNKRITECTLTV